MQFFLSLFFIAVFHSTGLAAVKSFAVVGDAGHWNPESKQVLDSISKSGVRHLVLPGDNLYFGSDYHRVWSHWLQEGMNFAAVAIGNHHVTYEKEMNYFKMPGEYYSYSPVRGLRFVVLNSDNEATADEQARFLDKTMTEAREPFIFVVYHHPSYTLSEMHPWKEKKDFQKAIRPLIWKHRPKIAALLVGHDHMASLVSLNSLPMVVSGAVWETRPVEPVDYQEGAVRVKTQWHYDITPHWARLDVEDTGKYSVSFVRARDNQVTCSAIFDVFTKRGRLAPFCRNRGR